MKSESTADNSKLTFWEHLDALRTTLLHIVIATTLLAGVAFCFKEELFGIILAPKHSDFITYTLLDRLSAGFTAADPQASAFQAELINTGLARQFMIHIRISLYAGLLLASPYILFQLFRFVSPALYASERRYTIKALTSASAMFALGIATAYFLIFPLTFRFLATYQVSPEIPNLITLDSYIDAMLMLCLLMGIMFELPALCFLLAKLGFITAAFLRRYRRHALVIILIVAAIITPTSDPFTLLATTLPIYLLYEASILLIRKRE